VLEPGKGAGVPGDRARRGHGRLDRRAHHRGGQSPLRYADAIAVRAFPRGEEWQSRGGTDVIRDFARYSDRPVINLESTRRHPCQGLADALTLREKLGRPRASDSCSPGLASPALPTAVPASAAHRGSVAGHGIVIARPPAMSWIPRTRR
jgi:N-acetylornithine carbamoyltransferase